MASASYSSLDSITTRAARDKTLPVNMTTVTHG